MATLFILLVVAAFQVTLSEDAPKEDLQLTQSTVFSENTEGTVSTAGESTTESKFPSGQWTQKDQQWLQEIHKLFNKEKWTEREDKLLKEIIELWFREIDSWLDDDYDDYDEDDNDDWWNNSNDWSESEEEDPEDKSDDWFDDSNEEDDSWFYHVSINKPAGNFNGLPFKRFSSV